MPKSPYLLLLLLFAALAIPGPAFAQDEDDDEEEEEDEEFEDEKERPRYLEDEDEDRRERRPKKKRVRKAREVVKGAYAKINMGALIWLPPISTYTASTGTNVDFSFGYDVLDRLNFTIAVEGSFYQAISNGTGSSLAFGIASPIQGDFRVFGGVANVRLGPNFGGRRIKRLSVMFQVGGGVGFSPLLVQETSANYNAGLQAWGGSWHGKALGIITPGLSFEYYTRLAHFSIGVDVDAHLFVGGPAAMAIGPAIVPTVFVKYTF